ncbi:MAG: CAP domain-containing protein, partial [Rhizomicrobium sp.]
PDRMTRFAIFALALLMLAACASTEPVPPQPDPQAQMAPLALRIAILVEEQRLKLDPNAKALAIDPELSKIAEMRARDMATKNYLAHAAPNGDTSASLLMADDAKWQGLLGENLAAQHYIKESGVDANAFAARFLDEWMKSDPHRENLAYPAYDRTGVGAAVNGDTVYVAQLFASDMGLKPLADADASTVTSYATPKAALKDAPPPPIHLRGAQGVGP